MEKVKIIAGVTSKIITQRTSISVNLNTPGPAGPAGPAGSGLYPVVTELPSGIPDGVQGVTLVSGTTPNQTQTVYFVFMDGTAYPIQGQIR